MVQNDTNAEVWAGPITRPNVQGLDQLYRSSELVDHPVAVDTAAAAGAAARAYNRAPFTSPEIRETDSVHRHPGRWNVAGRYVAALILAAAADRPRGDKARRALMVDEARLTEQAVQQELQAAEVAPGWFEAQLDPLPTGGVHLIDAAAVSQVFVTGPHPWGNGAEQAFWVATGSPAAPTRLALGPYGNAVVANVIAEAFMRHVIGLRAVAGPPEHRS